MKKNDDSTRSVTGRPILRLFKDYAWRYRWSYLAGVLFLWVTNYLTVSIPGQIGHAIDALRADQPLGRYVAAIAIMGVSVIVVRSLSRILIFNPGRHLEYFLRKDLFAHLLRLQPSFYATHKRGDIVSRASNDITWVRTLVGFAGLQAVNVTLAIVLTGWKMVSLSPRLTLMVLLPIMVGVGLVQFGIRRLFHLARRSQEQLGEISEHVLGSLQGMAAIQGFAAEDAFVERFEARNRDWLRTGMRLALIRSIALPLIVLSGGVAMFALIAVGGPMVLDGTLTVGQLAAFTALLTVFLPPLRSMGWMMSVVQRGRAALERIFELEYTAGPTGIFLKKEPQTGRIYYAKAFIYPLVAAPFVRLFGDNGFFVLHALLLAGLFATGFLYLRRAMEPAAASLYTATYLMASVALLYYFWITPEWFNLSLVFFATFLAGFFSSFVPGAAAFLVTFMRTTFLAGVFAAAFLTGAFFAAFLTGVFAAAFLEVFFVPVVFFFAVPMELLFIEIYSPPIIVGKPGN